MSSITININDFSKPNFNAKQWINSTLKPSSTENSTTEIDNEDDGGGGGRAKDTTILVTKLEIESESTLQRFDELSKTLLKSMPHLLYDLKVLADQVRGTQEEMESIRKKFGLFKDEDTMLEERLRRPHLAKTRMEECRQLLLEESNHLEKIKEEQESRKRETLRKEEEEKEAKVEEQEKAIAEEKQIQEQKEEKVEEIIRQEEEEKNEELSEEQKMMNEALEYGHVMLPPLRQSIPKPSSIQQIQNQATTSEHNENNNSYLQQISVSVTPQVSNVFKRIGVPLDKFWQS
ncbi:uncharacterized protein BX663DRAFT_506760 [Cokeromyces recurvatus]|uniref:uncharacterized protein n=1 Tax=Cokeromyces recurvatus TaxID=90255 RepID=UPI00221F526F|nr:uncharacterized protein BX663DRAFT_506760 [Cokeromyces recurvatus]KAI7903526.1 hypothetical protein BX663DRAFT_506760 [Cokeromyces recurvatus]